MRKFSILLVLLALTAAALGQQPATPLQQARQEFEAHNFKAAAELYRAASAAEPENAEALAGLVDSLEALGQWRAALPAVERLVALQPKDARRIHQLGRWRSWSGDARGVDSLLEACDMDKSQPQYCTDYAEVLAWKAQTRGVAVAQLRAVLANSPNYVPAMAQLAKVLSWRKATRAEAAGLFETALKMEPENTDLLNGKAQLLAWSGHSSDALELYDRVLSADPGNVDALRGKAQILNWRGNYAEASTLAKRASNDAPEDRQVARELARAQIGMHHYADARRTISSFPASDKLDGVRDEIERESGPWIETGVAFRRNAGRGEYDRATVAVSSPVGAQNRLIFRYTPTLYTDGDTFNSNHYGALLESHLGERVTLTTDAAAETFPRVSPEITGGMQARVRMGSSADFQAGFHRAPVDDSLLSYRGIDTGAGLSGQVTSNLINLGLGFRNRRHEFDGSVHYTDGVYTGNKLETNRRWALDGNFGKAVSGTPYLRLAYGFAYAQFDYDADAPVPLPNQAGGYFSPTRYLLNYAGLTVAHKFGRRFEIEATGTAGAQNVENSTSAFGDPAFAGSFSGRLLWRPAARDELLVRYEYLNVFNAFHRHLPGIAWRHYF
jgi:tetratricopeptide (TPR) repeat protein